MNALMIADRALILVAFSWFILAQSGSVGVYSLFACVPVAETLGKLQLVATDSITLATDGGRSKIDGNIRVASLVFSH